MIYSEYMANVTIPKAKYEMLQRQGRAYRKLAEHIFELAIQDPVEDVVEDFKGSNLYTDEFLKDLEDGLRKSSYVKKYVKKAAKK